MIHISKGNMKVGSIPNISLVPIKDCGNCEFCKKDCYASKAYRQYPNVRKAWNDNSEAFRKHLLISFITVEEWINRHKPKYFRIHVAGDMLNQKYLDGWKHVCANLPKTKFLTHTKMFTLDYSDLPDNMNVIFSMWPGMKDTAPEGPRAWLDDGTETRIPDYAIECRGKCDTCKICFGNIKDEEFDVVYKKH